MSLNLNSPEISPLSSCIISFLRIWTTSKSIHYNKASLDIKSTYPLDFFCSPSLLKAHLLFFFFLCVFFFSFSPSVKNNQMVLNISQMDTEETKGVGQLVIAV